MNRSRIVLWSAAVLVTLGVGFTSLPSADELRLGSSSRATQIDDLRTRTTVAEDALTDEQAFAAELAEARTAVPAEAGLPDLIEFVEGAIRGSGMVWVSGVPARAAPADDEGSADVETWRISVTVSGSESELAGLLEELATLPRLVVVDSLAAQTAAEGELSVNLSLRFFSSPGDPEAQRFETQNTEENADD